MALTLASRALGRAKISPARSVSLRARARTPGKGPCAPLSLLRRWANSPPIAVRSCRLHQSGSFVWKSITLGEGEEWAESRDSCGFSQQQLQTGENSNLLSRLGIRTFKTISLGQLIEKYFLETTLSEFACLFGKQKRDILRNKSVKNS